MIFELPMALEVNGVMRDIDPDYRQVLRILQGFEDPDMTDADKALVAIYNLYVDAEEIPGEDMQAAFDAALAFIDFGAGNGDDRPHPRTMDWTQDAPLIFPAVNRAAGCEVRSVEFMHWWTFVGYFMEISDSVYSTVLRLRGKKARGKKLEKQEQEFWRENRKICEFQTRYSAEELAEQERLNKLLG
jgi:hypothetical protein